MSELVKPELSAKNDYHIEKHRYHELKHFCRQYDNWVRSLSYLDGFSAISTSTVRQPTHDGRKTDQTGRTVEIRMIYENNINMVRKAASATDEFFASYLLLGVTNGLSFDHLRARANIPCCRKNYYAMYRKFFWILDKLRD